MYHAGVEKYRKSIKVVDGDSEEMLNQSCGTVTWEIK